MQGSLLRLIAALAWAALIGGCSEEVVKPPATHPDVDREDKLPSDIEKRLPETDHHPPILHSSEFEEPVPLPYPVNTAGAEDSPFMLPDGNTLYFFFTPDVRVPHDEQVLDDVSGIWVATRSGEVWEKPRRVWLQQPGRLALDGAVCVQDDEMWFASAREGYTGMNMFIAHLVDGQWKNWRYCGDYLMHTIGIGEVHLHGDDLYFHSAREGGKGALDIWVTTRSGDSWSDPVNIEAVNTPAPESLPFVSSDGNQLWFTRRYLGTPAIFRSLRSDGEWGEPELIVSQFAGEPTLDDAGNLYFVHHFYEYDVMIEADIYVAYRK